MVDHDEAAVKKAIEALRGAENEQLEKLREFLRIPSVSTYAEHRDDVEAAASWLARRLEALNAEEVRLVPTGGSPVVVGHLPPPLAGAPTVLVYGHYDVQPVEPLEEWRSKPFSPEIKGENLYARGASDMKGQIMAVLNALEALGASGGCPVGVRFLFEGEEEIGSPHLADFMKKHPDLLAADICLNPDAGMLGPGQPAITYALRGLAYFELRVRGPDHDLHSGAYGGAVHNPAQALCELIAGMHDETGRVTLPGFYDRVRALSAEERRSLAQLTESDRRILETAGVRKLWGEPDYSVLERIGARPTLEVNGLLSGFTGEGSKTVLPAAAMAKISTRLVADQRPEEVRGQLEAFIREHLPDTVNWELEQFAGGPPVLCPTDSPGVRALSGALETVWGRRPLFRRSGGSVPVGAYLQQYAGVDSVLTGFALPDDNMHAPNEKLHLPTWRKGGEALVYFFHALAAGRAEED
jgi:acetylornithine deacetylase/succinyl-diaminopimelate desuccinylase-like protein